MASINDRIKQAFEVYREDKDIGNLRYVRSMYSG